MSLGNPGAIGHGGVYRPPSQLRPAMEFVSHVLIEGRNALRQIQNHYQRLLPASPYQTAEPVLLITFSPTSASSPDRKHHGQWPPQLPRPNAEWEQLYLQSKPRGLKTGSNHQSGLSSIRILNLGLWSVGNVTRNQIIWRFQEEGYLPPCWRSDFLSCSSPPSMLWPGYPWYGVPHQQHWRRWVRKRLLLKISDINKAEKTLLHTSQTAQDFSSQVIPMTGAFGRRPRLK